MTDEGAIELSEQDLRQIRQLLMDHFGTAWSTGTPNAQADLVNVDSLSPQELVEEALRLGLISIG